METNKLYTVVTGDEGEGTSSPKAEPSEYLLKLAPREAITELKAHIKSLEERLAEFAKVDLQVPENLDKARAVSSELEIVQDLLRRLEKDHGTSG
jgi:hypothetical protein